MSPSLISIDAAFFVSCELLRQVERIGWSLKFTAFANSMKPSATGFDQFLGELVNDGSCMDFFLHPLVRRSSGRSPRSL